MREIEIDLRESPEAVIARARSLAEEQGWPFEGDQESGEFEAMGVTGNFRVTPGKVLVTIVEKPFLFPWPLVEEKIRSFFG